MIMMMMSFQFDYYGLVGLEQFVSWYVCCMVVYLEINFACNQQYHNGEIYGNMIECLLE